MDEPAMAGVDPVRRVEVQRRVRIVRDYVAGPRTAERRERAAAALGVTPGQFLRLVRIWRETGSPARLHGAGATRQAGRPTRSLTPEAEAAITAAIDEHGADASFSKVLADVESRCDAAGLPRPAGSTVHDRLNRRRGAAGGVASAGDRHIAIVKCSLRFPVASHAGLGRPCALLATLMPERLVIAAELGLDGTREPDLRRLLRRLDRASREGAPVTAVRAQRALMPGGADRASIEGVALEAARAGETSVSRVLGPRLGHLPVKAKSLSDRTFRERAAARLNTPLTMTQAAVELLRAIESHNSGRPAPDPAGFSLPSTAPDGPEAAL